MIAFIKANSSGISTGPFNIYSDATVPPYSAPFETGISQTTLDAGFFSYSVPPGTTMIRVKSMGPDCTNEVYVPLASGTLVVTNNMLPSDTIYGVAPSFYDFPFPSYSFPVFSGATSYFGQNSGFSGNLDVELDCTTALGKLELYINNVLVDCQNVPNIGLQFITFSGVTINPTDYVQIILSPGSC